jgi:hypothetical protein
MNLVRNLLIGLIVLVSLPSASAQEKFKRHKVMLVFAHAMTPEGINVDGKKTFLFLPSWGLDYDYRISEKWSVGIHSDFVIENFEFENPEEIVQERSTPLALVASAGYKIGKHFTAIVGGGAELAKEENLPVIRVGADYGWEIGEWEIALNYMIDLKLDAYNTGIFGVGLARSF